MKEQIICIVTPDARTYYKISPLAKEFLDKEHNVINSMGNLPEGPLTEYNISTATRKNLKNGKLDGKLEIINLADQTVSFCEEYKDGVLLGITGKNLQTSGPKAEDKKHPHYLGTILKTTKGSNCFYRDGKEVAEETISSNGASVELLGTIPDGIVKEFDDNGQIRTEAYYKNNKLNGIMVKFDEQGRIVSREQYVEGLLQGPAEYYYFGKEVKTVRATCSYTNSHLEGERRLTLENGVVVLTEHYKNGRLDGLRESFFPSGNPEQEEHYSDGKLHGDRTLYFPSGEVWYREYYSNGKLDGERLGYFANGKVRLEEFYTDGLLEGPRRIFAENGEMLASEEYHWGNLVHNTERN